MPVRKTDNRFKNAISQKSLGVVFATFILGFAHVALARPVSYPGGWTFMTMNDKDANSSHIHYTIDPKQSLGWRHEYIRGESIHVDTVQHNYLVKRWNAPGSQANIYLKSGVGMGYDSEASDLAAFTGLAVDWEDRRFFTSYENRFFWVDDRTDFIKHKARVGVAPYVGDYGDLHTWLMLQVNYDAGAEDSFSLTPMVRFFKGPSLLEVGYDTDNAMMFNFIQRF